MRRSRGLAIAATCGALLLPAAAAGGDRITVYPATGAQPRLGAIKSGSGLKVLLPEVMHLQDLTDGRRNYHFRVAVNENAYDLILVNGACPKRDPCRRIASFTADRTDDAPAGDIELAKGRLGSYTIGSCNGGGCTGSSIAWIERGARYRLYAYVSKSKLIGFVKQAILGGPR